MGAFGIRGMCWRRNRMKQIYAGLLVSSILIGIWLLLQAQTEHNDTVFKLNQEIQTLRAKIHRIQTHEVDTSIPIIYVITPTYTRPVQKAELTRLMNAFTLVPNLHWIIVEDSSSKTDLVKNLLTSFPKPSTHLNIQTPAKMKLKPKDKWWSKPRGVFQRNLALSWLKENEKNKEGIIYFADDDNTYSVDLFEEIRGTKRVSVLPVGLVGGVKVEKPQVSGGKVVGWEVGWGNERPFAVDMAGFAINLQYFLKHTDVKFLEQVKVGHQESEFLFQLVSLDQLEPVAVGRVLVWHTRTQALNLNREDWFLKHYGYSSDTGIEL
ncbi:galactosylgalactosylxylosylprotein 3-beta-glucuronosyltransferase I isoform X2 [Eurytemora carolleeae]|uniref:galactosylgalactosylxylosylprotein 3-beta-glucuronosyltransferase I isoform X1 n=1 Tax=Eurytemora carolleeae TaxID=1294199 RepID=UPI000C78725B|nr:galactosylgalactosylxylosylprotein 3-beta-glucuronosyltransferase I isoform X1 [Eurytemora carolleeae]XP_023322280.1 galactosylgalactosylxylosylprotein 3-beta-glucuronosyltransferase I isoform X2 [Eurytemora carolleeae]|eukprot:XP_023322279.1 galactosylgalactosylxylosylprotein 3-beta-glucuronosyltransferase I-like isoform X1 [Eurytemora affinis]